MATNKPISEFGFGDPDYLFGFELPGKGRNQPNLRRCKTAAALVTDARYSYTAGDNRIQVATGDILEAGGARYEVQASGASDQDLTTAGGVKLKVRGAPKPAAFGAVAGSDATAAINAAIQCAKAQGIKTLDLGDAKYTIAGLLVIDSVRLTNVQLVFSGNSSGVRLTGTNPGIADFHIDYGSTFPSGYIARAVLGLHLSSGAYIGKGVITGSTRRYAVMCVSLASYTTIEDNEIHCPWGILYDDKNSRVVDGVDYEGQVMGQGLIIRGNSYWPDPAGSLSGDGIEINCPDNRFKDVLIEGNRIYGTVTSASVGLGIACANVDGVVMRDNTVYNCATTAGGLHVEWCTDAIITGNRTIDCVTGLSAAFSANTLVAGNTFRGCKEFSLKSQGTVTGGTMTDFIIRDNVFAGLLGRDGWTAYNDIIIGNATRVTIDGNRFLGFGETGKTHISLTTYDSTGCSHVELTGNVFANTLGFAATGLLGADANATALFSAGNNFTTYSTPGASMIATVRARGVCLDRYKTTGDIVDFKGGLPLTGGTPQGYITGAADNLAIDIKGGDTYRYDGTAASWSRPGSAWSNPLRLTNSFIWALPGGQIRAASAAPSSDTSGTAIGQRRSVPATPSSPGRVGDWSDDADYFYWWSSASGLWCRIARDPTW